MKDGLCYVNNRIYIPGYHHIKMMLIQEYHDGTAGHLRYEKTRNNILKTYYWEDLPKDVKKFIKTCDVCQRIKSSTQKPFGLLQPIAPPSEKFEAYSMDFIGPLPITKAGYDFIYVIVDMLTKAVFLKAIKTTYGAKEIAEIFFDNIIRRFGCPKKIVSD